ncbi:hypothetical protein Fmac_007715 [Flemingia macrophylla]|uniref:Uncharacterized protein n=1 Tax=Flemingia macrophylla TaxID=520843 RepID=A0ABD1MVB8_9FABA
MLGDDDQTLFELTVLVSADPKDALPDAELLIINYGRKENKTNLERWIFGFALFRLGNSRSQSTNTEDMWGTSPLYIVGLEEAQRYLHR